MIQFFTRNVGWKILSLGIALALWVSVAREPEVATSLSAPVDFKLGQLFKRIPNVIYHGLYEDETAAIRVRVRSRFLCRALTATLLPNELGLFDTLGGVYEWCQDRNDAYRSARVGPLRDVAIAETINDQINRMFRGGAFLSSASEARSASRGTDGPYYNGAFMGFRVARTCPPPP